MRRRPWVADCRMLLRVVHDVRTWARIWMLLDRKLVLSRKRCLGKVGEGLSSIFFQIALLCKLCRAWEAYDERSDKKNAQGKIDQTTFR